MSGQNVAIKIEPADVASSDLEHEHCVLLHLSGISSIPGVHWCGQEARYNMLVFDYLVFNTSSGKLVLALLDLNGSKCK
jgi:hypothetical protein